MYYVIYNYVVYTAVGSIFAVNEFVELAVDQTPKNGMIPTVLIVSKSLKFIY